MLEPVLRSPELSFSIQRWRSGATGAGAGISIGCTRALPIRPRPSAGAGAGAGVGAGVLRITGFYETPPATRSLLFFPPRIPPLRARASPGLGPGAGRAIQAWQRDDRDRQARPARAHRRPHGVRARRRDQ